MYKTTVIMIIGLVSSIANATQVTSICQVSYSTMDMMYTITRDNGQTLATIELTPESTWLVKNEAFEPSAVLYPEPDSAIEAVCGNLKQIDDNTQDLK